MRGVERRAGGRKTNKTFSPQSTESSQLMGVCTSYFSVLLSALARVGVCTSYFSVLPSTLTAHRCNSKKNYITRL